jgi:transcriptional regulator with XRE-family HTH domain
MTPKQIRKERERLGLTLDGLGEALGVDRMTVWRWEQADDSIHHRTPAPYLRRALRDLARELGGTP